MNPQILEKEAYRFRTVILGISSDDCIPVNHILQKLDVLTVFKKLSSGFSGMAIKVQANQEKKFILVNSSHARGKQNFTICHELYHLYIQKDFSSQICFTGRFDKSAGEEYNADVFASYLILPESGMLSHIPNEEIGKNKITIKTILKIEQYFSCSRAALLYRLKNLNIIDSRVYDQFGSNVMKSALQHGYGLELYQAGNHDLVIGDYGTIAKELYDNGKISESHYFSLLLELGMNTDQIENILNGEETSDNIN